MNDTLNTAPASTAVVTTQNAPLERFLTRWRTVKIRPYVKQKAVLDFGCGEHLTTLRALETCGAPRFGFDIRFAGRKPWTTPDGITIVGGLDDLSDKGINCVTALAVFEHLEPEIFLKVLAKLDEITPPDAVIVGTVPTPLGKPVLEFLSNKWVGLIDKTQIDDHKVYYDRPLLERTLSRSNWRLGRYHRFQLGMNSFFKLEKCR